MRVGETIVRETINNAIADRARIDGGSARHGETVPLNPSRKKDCHLRCNPRPRGLPRAKERYKVAGEINEEIRRERTIFSNLGKSQLQASST
jgi:hypothetical protein